MVIKQITKEEISLISSSVFHSRKWLNILGEHENPYGIFDDNGLLKGGFLLAKEKIYGLNFFRPPRMMNTISLFYTKSSSNHAKKFGEEKKLMQSLSNFFEDLPYQILTIYLPCDYVDMQPFIWGKFKVIPNYTYIINLTLSIFEIEARFTTERRNEIKKAIKDGIICRKENRPDIVKQIAQSTFSRKRKKIKLVYFDKVLFDFADSENSVTYISYKDEIPIAAAFCIYDNEKMYYILGGYNPKMKHQGAGSLALFNAMKYAKEIGIHFFDFEGSMLQEVEKYFRGFGGDLVPYFSVSKAKLPLEIILKFFKRSVF